MKESPLDRPEGWKGAQHKKILGNALPDSAQGLETG